MTRLRSPIWQAVCAAGLSMLIATGCSTLGAIDGSDEVSNGEEDEGDGDVPDDEADDGIPGGDCGCEEILAECNEEMGGGGEGGGDQDCEDGSDDCVPPDPGTGDCIPDETGECKDDPTEGDPDCADGSCEEPGDDGEETGGYCQEVYDWCVTECAGDGGDEGNACDTCEGGFEECIEASGDDPEAADACVNAYDECAASCDGEGGDTCAMCDAGFDECAAGAESDEEWIQCEDDWSACNRPAVGPGEPGAE